MATKLAKALQKNNALEDALAKLMSKMRALQAKMSALSEEANTMPIVMNKVYFVDV